jgi:nucleotide-binding universal stress UspA family protein
MARLNLSHMLTGTDFSEASKGAVREALRLAAADASRRVSVVHVAREVRDAAGLRERVRTWTEALPEFAALSAGQVVPVLEVGGVVDGLSRCVQRVGATQMVIGPRPRGFLEKWFTGGVAEQLFHNVRVPVLATRGPQAQGYGRILVAVDFSSVAMAAVEMAADMARESEGCKLELVHVAQNPAAGRDLPELRAGMRATIERDLREFAAGAGLSEGVHVRVEFGAVQQVVPDVACGGCDLVCMASRSSGSFLGSTVDAVLRSTRVPMLVVYVPA